MKANKKPELFCSLLNKNRSYLYLIVKSFRYGITHNKKIVSSCVSPSFVNFATSCNFKRRVKASKNTGRFIFEWFGIEQL